MKYIKRYIRNWLVYLLNKQVELHERDIRHARKKVLIPVLLFLLAPSPASAQFNSEHSTLNTGVYHVYLMEAADNSNQPDVFGTSQRDFADQLSLNVQRKTGKFDFAAEAQRASSEYYRAATPDSVFPLGDFDFTISLWVYFINISGANTQQIILSRWWAGTNERQFIIGWTNIAPERFRWVLSSNGATNTEAQGTITMQDSTWYNIIVWNKSDVDSMGIVVDGTETKVAHSGGAFDVSNFETGDETVMFIDNNTVNYCDCRVDELIFWTRRLSSQEITWLAVDEAHWGEEGAPGSSSTERKRTFIIQ